MNERACCVLGRNASRWFAAAALVIVSGAVQADPFTAYIREFEVARGSVAQPNVLGTFFIDRFEDGNPPPAKPADQAASLGYGVQGSFANGESNGKLRIGGDGYVLSANALGQPAYLNSATLLTDRSDDPNATNGLRQMYAFEVVGAFDYVAPSAGESYGVRLTDGGTQAATGQNDVVEVRVAWSNVWNAPFVRFYRQNFFLGTIEELGALLLPTSGFDGIILGLLHEEAGSQDIRAGYAFLNGGVESDPVFFNTKTTIFNGESWTRADFRAAANVPEPATLALLGLGLAGLAASRRRKR